LDDRADHPPGRRRHHQLSANPCGEALPVMHGDDDTAVALKPVCLGRVRAAHSARSGGGAAVALLGGLGQRSSHTDSRRRPQSRRRAAGGLRPGRGAVVRLGSVWPPLNSLLPLLHPSSHESDALSAGDFEYADDLEHSRMLNICSYSQVVMETSLKALIHTLKEPHPANIHSIGGLIDAAGSRLSPYKAVQLESCLGQISPQDASAWRETSTYPADARIKGDPQTATPEFAAQMARAAVQMTQTCVSLITGELGYQPAEAQQALARCHHIRQELPSRDTPTQDRNFDIAAGASGPTGRFGSGV